MHPSTMFLRNPRLTLLLIGLVLVAGTSSFMILPRMEDPLLTERAAFVITSLPGADAEQVESLVTDPIEDELREIAEIKELRSSSRSSLSTITIELRDDVYADEAPNLWSRIRDRIADAEADLPVNASKPRFERIEVTAYTRLIALVPDRDLSVATLEEGPAMPDPILRRKAEELRELLLGVSGTKDVEIFGDPEEEVLVEIEPDRLASIGLSVAEVSRLIQSSDSRFSAGLLRNSERDLLIEVSGELDSVDRIASIPLQTTREGHVTLLGDVAKIRRGIREPISELSVVQGQPAIVLACLIRPSQRIDDWNVQSKVVTDEFSARLTRGISLVDVFSQDGYVTERLTSLIFNLLLGAGSVMIVIFVLMGWRSAVIVGAALPLSAMMVFAGMRFMDIPIHQMSVTGLIIALGLLIDNAIVVVDEVSQKLRSGDTPVEAVRKTVSHLAVPLFGSTFTTALAFAPIALMPGPAGEFVGSIAVNVIVAIFSSLALSLSVVPALTGFLANASAGNSAAPGEARRSAWYRDGVSSGWMLSLYKRLLQVVVRRPIVGIGLGVVLPVCGFAAKAGLSEQFFPPADRDQIAIELELSSQTSVAETLASTSRIRDDLLRRDGVEEVTWWVGRSAPPFYYNQIPSRRGVSQYAQALVKLDNADNLPERINRMQKELDQEFPEAQVLVRQLEQGPPFEAPIEVQVFGPDLKQLAVISDRISAILAAIPEVTHVRSEASQLEPRLTLNIDEDEARLLGMTHESVAQQMFSSLEGAVGGMILEGTEELPVRVRVASEDRTTIDAVESIDVVSGVGESRTSYRGVPLTALGNVELKPERASVTRLDRRRMTEVQAFLEAGVLPAEGLAEFQRRLDMEMARSEQDDAIPPVLPPGYKLEFAGEAAQRDDAVGNLMASVGVLAVLMIAALVLSFRSFRLASLIGVVAVLAVGLGVGALWIFGHPFGFMAIIGTMGLVGVAINDSIVVLAAIQEDAAARNGDTNAIQDVVVRATRHVVATSLTTIAGFLPLILAGGGFWPPMAVTIAGGVGGATVLALIFVPACYLLLMKPGFECSVVALPHTNATLAAE